MPSPCFLEARTGESGQTGGNATRRACMAVHYETDGPVAVITLDRPDVANAIDRPTAEQLVAAFQRFDADGELSVAVLTGAGGKFCAVADLTAMREHGAPRPRRV